MIGDRCRAGGAPHTSAEAHARFARGDYAGAYALLRKARDSGPPDARLLSDLGAAAFAVGRTREAEEALVLALMLDPGLEEARANLEMICRARGRSVRSALEAAMKRSAPDGGRQVLAIEPQRAVRYDLSVVMPLHDGLETFATCLDTLAAQTFPRSRYEVIVVINGLSEKEMQHVEQIIGTRRARFGERLLLRSVPEASIAAARNEGLRWAAGRIVIQTNSDASFARDALARHWAEHEAAGFDPAFAVCGGRRFDEAHRRNLFNFLYEEVPLYTPLHEPGLRFVADPEWLVTVNFSAARETYVRYGGFDPAHAWGSDVMLGRRWAGAFDLRLVVNTDIVTWHLHRLTFDSWRAKLITAVPHWLRRGTGKAVEDLTEEDLARTESKRRQYLERNDPAIVEREMRRLEAAFAGPDAYRPLTVLGGVCPDIGTFVWRLRAALKEYRLYVQHEELLRLAGAAAPR